MTHVVMLVRELRRARLETISTSRISMNMSLMHISNQKRAHHDVYSTTSSSNSIRLDSGTTRARQRCIIPTNTGRAAAKPPAAFIITLLQYGTGNTRSILLVFVHYKQLWNLPSLYFFHF